jgi:hypothetical protein
LFQDKERRPYYLLAMAFLNEVMKRIDRRNNASVLLINDGDIQVVLFIPDDNSAWRHPFL